MCRHRKVLYGYKADRKEMGDPMNKVTVRICGQEYTLKGEENEAYLKQVGKEVHQMITSILERNHQIDTSSASVLAALNAVDRANKKEAELLGLKSAEGSVYKKAEGLKEEMKLLEVALEKTQRENKKLQEEVSKLKQEDSKEKLQKEREIKRLETELRLTQDSAKEYRDENESLSKLSKELKFELQSYKYKVLELQKKLFDTQLTQTKEHKEKEKREKNPILKEKSK